MEAVLDVYARPYDPERPVVCLDEKRKQLVGETRAPFTDSAGVRHVDYEYERAGVGVLYADVPSAMVCEPLGGQREVRVEARQDRLVWARTVAHMAETMYPHPTSVGWRPSGSRWCRTTSRRTSRRRSTRSCRRSERGRSCDGWRS